MNKLNIPITSQKIIRELIPQQDPFVMVDALLEYEEQRIVSRLVIGEDNILVKDNRFSEAGMIEHMAQTIALHRGYTDLLNDRTPSVGYIGAIKKAEIEYIPQQGEAIETEAKILHEIMGVTLVTIVSKVGDKVVARAQIKTAIAKK